jgi:hypothetical protein
MTSHYTGVEPMQRFADEVYLVSTAYSLYALYIYIYIYTHTRCGHYHYNYFNFFIFTVLTQNPRGQLQKQQKYEANNKQQTEQLTDKTLKPDTFIRIRTQFDKNTNRFSNGISSRSTHGIHSYCKTQ